MVANNLLFPVLSGLILLGVAALVLRVRRWRRGPEELRRGTSRPLPTTRTSSPSAELAGTLNSPTGWTAGFLLLVLVTLVGSLAVVGALPIPESVQGLVGTVMLLVGAIVLGGFVFAGVYSSVRNRGHGSAPATGLAMLVLGTIALVVVVVQLLLGA